MSDQARPEVTAQSFHDVFVGGLDREARKAGDISNVLESIVWFITLISDWRDKEIEEKERTVGELLTDAPRTVATSYDGMPWLDIAVRLENAAVAARRLAGG